MVLIVDERCAPVLARVSVAQWDTVQALVRCCCEIVRARAAEQPAPRITAPDVALVHSLFRTLRAEDPALPLTTLNVAASNECYSDDYSDALGALRRLLLTPLAAAVKITAASAVLPPHKTEVVLCGGVERVTRLLSRERTNRAERELTHGRPPPVTAGAALCADALHTGVWRRLTSLSKPGMWGLKSRRHF
jgi:hypothetical protein